jgi:hypothetical protein
MAKSAQLRAKIRKAKKEIRAADKEIHTLMKHLKAGTLDRKKLESGLVEIRAKVRGIPDHDGPE